MHCNTVIPSDGTKWKHRSLLVGSVLLCMRSKWELHEKCWLENVMKEETKEYLGNSVWGCKLDWSGSGWDAKESFCNDGDELSGSITEGNYLYVWIMEYSHFYNKLAITNKNPTHEADSLLGYSAMLSHWSRLTFQSCYFPEDYHLHARCCENPKSHTKNEVTVESVL
jgi:hypothetical protein